MTNILPREHIERSILLIRGHKVMLDADFAELYGVETRALLQAVSRNQKRFPKDFMFQMSKEEYELFRSQIVISKKGGGGRRYLPVCFRARMQFEIGSKQTKRIFSKAFSQARERIS